MKKLTARQLADRKYHAKVDKKTVVFNDADELEKRILKAFDDSGLEFSPLCKQLLAKHFNLR